MSDVIYTAADGEQYKAVPGGSGSCRGCAFAGFDSLTEKCCSNSQGVLDCSPTDIIWQPITIQKPVDNFHQWLQKNAEVFRPIFERMEGKE